MNIRIDVIDMYRRDEDALNYILKKAGQSREVLITGDELATSVRCSRRTTTAILSRLRGAGHITFKGQGRAGTVITLL